MSLPPALLARLAQRGLVQKQQKQREQRAQEDGNSAQAVENEEVIAEDYDEMEDSEQNQGPEQYPSHYERKRPTEENYWLERMKARMGESTSASGYKGCPNKYNIWHKCTLFCVTRWAEGNPEPSRDYIRRYKRLLRKYPLPKGWTEMYDPGCGCYYFYSASENLVSWLSPTHPKSQVSKSAAVLRRQLEEVATGDSGGSDGEDVEEEENAATRHQREVEEIISASMRPRSPRERGGKEDVENSAPRKPKTRDLERVVSRQREREKERGRERERDRDRERGSGYGRRNFGREEPDILDPMDPSSYSDTPRGKWSSGLNTGSEERSQKQTAGEGADNKRRKERREESSDDDKEEEEEENEFN